MITIFAVSLLFVIGSLSALAAESGDSDRERRLVKEGVLGTINVLRELDIKTGTNRVKATSNVDDKACNTVTFGALWDDTCLYVGVKVLDANLQKTSETWYMNDSVEVYADPTHNQATQYDPQDRQFVKVWNDAAIYEANAVGVQHGWAAIPGGYTVELAIPWSNLGVTPSAGMTLGFDVGNNNSDGSCGRNTQLMWHGNDQNWQDTSAFGDLILSTQIAGERGGAASPDAAAALPANAVTARKTAGKLTVDGKLDEAAWSLPMTAGKLLSGTGNGGDTIDGSGKTLQPKQDGSAPLILNYALAGLRTVSSLVIAYEGGPARSVQMEGSADGGKTWFKVFKNQAFSTDFLKCFKPVTANALRLTLEGGGLHHIQEVFVYADPETPLPLFGGADSGAFSFLRNLWYAGKIKEIRSPGNEVWVQAGGRDRAPFMSRIINGHDGSWGEGYNTQPDKRLYLRLDVDKAYPMNFGLLSGAEGDVIARESRAEFYTANGNLDPSSLKGNTQQDLTAQGWILQKAWNKDPDLCKGFPFARPGKYSQMLLVWDCSRGSRWSHLEMFGVETPAKDGADKTQ